MVGEMVGNSLRMQLGYFQSNAYANLFFFVFSFQSHNAKGMEFE